MAQAKTRLKGAWQFSLETMNKRKTRPGKFSPGGSGDTFQLVKNPPRESARGPKPFRASIVPGGVYGGDGAIFAEENPIFQSKIASLQFPRPEIRRILAETGRGGSGGGVYSPVHQFVKKTFLTS